MGRALEDHSAGVSYPRVRAPHPKLSIVMPFTASPREIEALAAWDKSLIVLFACDTRVYERALELGFRSVFHGGRTAATIQPGSDRPFIRDMLETLLAVSPGDDWYGIANSDIRPCPHAFFGLCRANIYHRLSVDDWDDHYGIPYFNGEDMFVMTEAVVRSVLAEAPHFVIGVPYWDSWMAAYLKVAHDAPRYYDRIFHKKHPLGHSLRSPEAAYNQRVLKSDKYWHYYWRNRERFSHEAHRDPSQMPLHYTAT